MAVAYFMVHDPQGFFPLLNGGEGAILYCFAFLYLAAAGAGPWSVDSLRDLKHLRPDDPLTFYRDEARPNAPGLHGPRRIADTR